MSQPPEYVPDLSDTQRIARDITDAMRALRRDWPHMIRPGEKQAPGWASRNGAHVTNPDVVDADGRLLDGHKPHELDRSYEDLALRGHGAPDSDTRRIDRIVSLRVHVTKVLNSWSKVVIEDRGTTNHIPSGFDAPGMAAFIERHADWLSGHETGEDARDELRDLAHRCHLTAYPRRKESMSIGRCPFEIPGELDVLETCNGDVRYRLDPDERDGEAMAACNRCGEAGVLSWWEDRMFDDPELRRTLTADGVVTLVHRQYGDVIKPGTVRQWVARGIIEPSGSDDKGRTTYDRDAVVYALDLWKRRQAVTS